MLVLLATLFAARGILIFSRSDVFFYLEELVTGSLARAYASALDLPYYERVYHYHEGGRSVSAVLTLGAFEIFGQNLLAHKLVSVVLDSIGLIFTYLLLRRMFGASAGFITGLCYIFSPIAFQKLSLLNCGSHYHGVAFLSALFWTFYCIWSGDRRRRMLIAYGASSALAIYYTYGNMPAVVLTGLLLLVRMRLVALGTPALFVAFGFLVAGVPMIYAFWNLGFQIFEIHGGSLLQIASLEEPTKGGAARRNFGDQDVWDLGILALAAIPVVGAAVYYKYSRKSPYWILFGYSALFALVFLLSKFKTGGLYAYYSYSRLSPLWWGCTVCAGAALHFMIFHSARWMKAGGAAGLLLLVGSGIYECTREFRIGSPSELKENYQVLSSTNGTRYIEYLAVLAHRVGMETEEFVQMSRNINDKNQVAVLLGISAAVSGKCNDPAIAIHILKKGFSITPRPALLQLGYRILEYYNYNVLNAWKWLRQLAIIDERERYALLEALGRAGKGIRPKRRNTDIEDIQRNACHSPDSPYTLGAGERIYSLFPLSTEDAKSFIERQPAELQATLFKGYEIAREMHRAPL